MRRDLRRPAALLTAVLLIALIGFSAGAEARDAEDLQVSPDKPLAEHNYPIPPVQSAGGSTSPNAHTPTVCRTEANQSCDTIDLDIIVPGGYLYSFSVRLTVSWEEITGLEDLDVWFFDDRENNLSGGEAAGSRNPERYSIFDPDPGRYYITVNNFSGVHADEYQVKIEFIQGEKKGLVKRRPTPPPVLGPSSPGSPSDPSEPREVRPFFTSGASVGGVSPGGSFAPIKIEFPKDEQTGGFTPVPFAGSETKPPSTIHWDTNRLLLGGMVLAAIALTSYGLFFVPLKGRRPRRATQPAH